MPSLTVADCVREAARRLKAARLSYGHGAMSALAEAEFLVTETLGLPPGKRVNAKQRAAIKAIIDARIRTRKPAAYLVNKMYLQGLPFYVDERVIVPRSFIAEILTEGFPLVESPKTILDLCTGSGCLAVLAALLFPKAKVDAVELSPDAAAVARRNIRDHRLQRRVKLYEGDLFAPVRRKKYDLIITNPPYVAPASMRRLPSEYRHEPAMALAGGGKDGLDIVRRILKEAPRHLNPGGGLICEIGAGRKALEKSCPRLPFLWLETANSAGEVFWLDRDSLNYDK
jgi:ribosomal protein L3 glutamine methyltransferase